MATEPLDYEPPGRSQPVGATFVCPSCGGTDTVRGTMVGGHLWNFLPSGVTAGVLGMRPHAAEAWAYACLTCGVVTCAIDPEVLRHLMQRHKPGGTGGEEA